MSAPIEPQDYSHGVRVVQIDGYRIARGKAKREFSACKHLNIVYDMQERRIWCENCRSDVEPFDALVGLAEHWDRVTKNLERRRKEALEAESNNLISRASKVIDEAWRSRKMAPMCPHCSAALLPDDFVSGVSMCSKELEIARRKRGKTHAPD